MSNRLCHPREPNDAGATNAVLKRTRSKRWRNRESP
jgi:hypothetical protein